MSEEQTLNEIGGLAALGNIDMEEAAEFRSGPMPKGIYLFKVEKMYLDAKDWNDKDSGEERNGAQVVLELSIGEVLSLRGVTLDDDELEQLKQRKFTHNFFFGDKTDGVKRGVGAVKAFAVDIGLDCAGQTLDSIMEMCVDQYFKGAINQKPNKNDPDNPYSNLDLNKIAPND